MAVKAIHLESEIYLTAEGFVAAFRRIVNRRKICHHIYSGNGTQCVGTDNELARLLKQLENQQYNEVLKEFGEQRETQIHVIPAGRHRMENYEKLL